jgi:hypothetical protein
MRRIHKRAIVAQTSRSGAKNAPGRKAGSEGSEFYGRLAWEGVKGVLMAVKAMLFDGGDFLGKESTL